MNAEEWKSRGNYTELVDCVISSMQMEHLKKRISEIFEKEDKEIIFGSMKHRKDFYFLLTGRRGKNLCMPTIYYIAVDKRNQMHIEDKHMISEYMLVYYLKKHIIDENLDLREFWDEVSELKTEVKYISSSKEYKEFEIGEYKILVEDGELHLDYL